MVKGQKCPSVADMLVTFRQALILTEAGSHNPGQPYR